MRTSSLVVLLSTLVLGGCAAEVLDDDEAWAAVDGASSALVKPAGVGRSLLIRRPSVLSALDGRYDLGRLLGQVARFENRQANDRTRTVGQYVSQIFDNALRNQLQNDDDPNRIGGSPFRNRYQDAVLRNWRTPRGRGLSEAELRAIDDPEQLRESTFRLLAVVDRLDLAGDFDERKTGVATDTPRYLGEVHLIYGLVDPGFEAAGAPFPGTYVASYRLPVLARAADGGLRVDGDFDDSVFREGGAEWAGQIRKWARLWAGLAEVQIDTPEYRRRLRRILDLAVRPANFLSLKSNVRIRENEWELREWYVSRSGASRGTNPNGQLIARKPRREPYRCLEGSDVLTGLVQHYWDPEHQDLDMSTRRPALPRGAVNDERRAGYALFRDNRRPYMEDWVRTMPRNEYWTDECGARPADMPFGMLTGATRNQPPAGDPDTDMLMFLAPFARVRGAGPVWELGPGADEAQRHAFAIRTCSGCHSQEAATQGFHVAPRMPGDRAELSAYLTGEGANVFRRETDEGPVEYRYQQLEVRRQWLNALLEGTAELYDSLRRSERLRH